MSILKFKNPETGAWEKVGIPGTDITPESIGAATMAEVNAAIASSAEDIQAMIPTKTSDLENNSGFITNDDIPTSDSEVFIAEYGVTTPEEVYEAHQAGKMVFARYDSFFAPLSGYIDSYQSSFMYYGSLSIKVLRCEYRDGSLYWNIQDCMIPPSSIYAGAFSGAVEACWDRQDPASFVLRNTTLRPEAKDPLNDGEIVWVYE